MLITTACNQTLALEVKLRQLVHICYCHVITAAVSTTALDAAEAARSYTVKSTVLTGDDSCCCTCMVAK